MKLQELRSLSIDEAAEVRIARGPPIYFTLA